MTQARTSVAFPPMWLTNDDGGEPCLLASSEAEAQAEAQRYYGLDGVTVQPDGWMMDVGWDRERYERKRDFLAETGYTSWWTACGGSHDSRTETKKLRRAWEVVFSDLAESK